MQKCPNLISFSSCILIDYQWPFSLAGSRCPALSDNVILNATLGNHWFNDVIWDQRLLCGLVPQREYSPLNPPTHHIWWWRWQWRRWWRWQWQKWWWRWRRHWWRPQRAGGLCACAQITQVATISLKWIRNDRAIVPNFIFNTCLVCSLHVCHKYTTNCNSRLKSRHFDFTFIHFDCQSPL